MYSRWTSGSAFARLEPLVGKRRLGDFAIEPSHIRPLQPSQQLWPMLCLAARIDNLAAEEAQGLFEHGGVEGIHKSPRLPILVRAQVPQVAAGNLGGPVQRRLGEIDRPQVGKAEALPGQDPAAQPAEFAGTLTLKPPARKRARTFPGDAISTSASRLRRRDLDELGEQAARLTKVNLGRHLFDALTESGGLDPVEVRLLADERRAVDEAIAVRVDPDRLGSLLLTKPLELEVDLLAVLVERERLAGRRARRPSGGKRGGQMRGARCNWPISTTGKRSGWIRIARASACAA